MIENIRKIIPQDIPYLYEISLQTAIGGNDGTDYFNNPMSVGHYYSAPYLQFEPQLCFTALDYNSRPSGYIVGTSNTVLFNSWLNTKWLPPLQKYYRRSIAKSEEENRIIQQLLKGQGQGIWEHSGYPAHLHINLLPSLQGKGLGRGLVETYLSKLFQMRIPGVHLGVDGKNTHAIGFYQKIGFTVLEETKWGYFMGRKLN